MVAVTMSDKRGLFKLFIIVVLLYAAIFPLLTLDKLIKLLNRASIFEAGNLLLMPPRLRDDGDWVKMSQALTAAAVRVEQAADAKNIDLMLTTGGELYTACTNCHEQYLMEQP